MYTNYFSFFFIILLLTTQVDDRNSKIRVDPRLVNIALSCVNAVFVALTSLDVGDVLFRASVGLRVALLHEIGSEACWGKTNYKEESSRRLRSAIQCAR